MEQVALLSAAVWMLAATYLLGRILARLREILALLSANEQTEEKIMALLDDILLGVKANKDAADSAVTLLQNLKTALDNAGVDPVKLQAIKDQLASNTQELADAVVANTPAEP